MLILTLSDDVPVSDSLPLSFLSHEFCESLLGKSWESESIPDHDVSENVVLLSSLGCKQINIIIS